MTHEQAAPLPATAASRQVNSSSQTPNPTMARLNTAKTITHIVPGTPVSRANWSASECGDGWRRRWDCSSNTGRTLANSMNQVNR